MQLMPLGLDNVLLPSEEAQERMREAAQRKPTAEAGRRKWRRGEMEFEALMRHLDNAVSINLAFPRNQKKTIISLKKIHQIMPEELLVFIFRKRKW